jgi:ribonuclease Z
VLPDYPNSRAPQQNFDDGALVVPHPTTSREEIQEPFVREMEIPPEEYYPEGYHPELLTEWPVESDLVVPLEVLPPSLEQSMGENWRQHKAYEEEMKKRDDEV